MAAAKLVKIINILENGAIGDGKNIDSSAINRIIASADSNTPLKLVFPKGKYLCLAIKLRSNMSIIFENGVQIIAAPFIKGVHEYDFPEENPNNIYQDFGHSHWQNSLFYGVNCQNIKISGTGLIIGDNLYRESPGPIWTQNGEFPNSMSVLSQEEIAILAPNRIEMLGRANKVFGFCDCKNISLDSLTIINGGHFAILATNVENLSIKDLLIDTNRDGIDIDCCQNVEIENCTINSPNDDAIVLKSSLARGRKIATKNVLITNCRVSGFDVGSVYTKTFSKIQEFAPDNDRVTGRIKIGTETNGDFENIRIENCEFTRSRGIAIESVDGGNIKNVDIENIKMDEVTSAPIFVKLGARMRAPLGEEIGLIKNIKIQNLRAKNIMGDYCAMILGLGESKVENVHFSNISLQFNTSNSKQTDFDNKIIEKTKTNYPEPSMHGKTPAKGFWIENAKSVKIENLELTNSPRDDRPNFMVRNSNNILINGKNF